MNNLNDHTVEINRLLFLVCTIINIFFTQAFEILIQKINFVD